MTPHILSALVFICLLPGSLRAEEEAKSSTSDAKAGDGLIEKAFPPIPALRKQGAASQLLVDGRPFIVIGGEAHNSSASSLPYMDERVWKKFTEYHCNTILLPISWELLEPKEGQFDFSLIDGILAGARTRGLRVVPLWFGTWKNGWSSYVPAWVKTDLSRFPRVQRSLGNDSTTLSPFSEEGCAADARAFRALMKHLREVDSAHRTVIMVQVENEAGLQGASRDHSAAAEKIFHAAVPRELLTALAARKENLRPELRTAWEKGGRKSSGNWPEVFGEMADETFMAWHIARYVGRVAKAGREEYLLPCYANAWLVQPGEKPGFLYLSGGPVSRVRDIWQIAAPDIFTLAPDIYMDDFAGVCADYTTGDNPLLIPEAKLAGAAAHALYAFGRYDALCFSPFGFEDANDPALARTYQILNSIAPVISAHQGTEQMTAVLQGTAETETVDLKNYRAEVQFHSSRKAGKAGAAAMIIQETPDSLMVVGLGDVEIRFSSRSGEQPNAEFLQLEEGSYDAGQWRAGRRLNGDELVLRFGDEPQILRASLYRY